MFNITDVIDDMISAGGRYTSNLPNLIAGSLMHKSKGQATVRMDQ